LISDYKHTILRKNHATGIPQRVLYLDTETNQNKETPYNYHSMKLAWTCSARYNQSGIVQNEQWRFWLNKASMWDYIERLAVDKSTLTVFAHNVFFDLQASEFFNIFPEKGWIHDFFYERGLTYILVIKKDDRRINFLSTTNFFDLKLKAIGEMIGLEKLGVDFEKATLDELTIYCRRDVEIIKKTVEHYFSLIIKHDLGQFSKTRASQAFRAYRHKFMNNKIYIHDNDEVKELERRAYYGGRVECFEYGKVKNGPFVTLDINSMYPFVMSYLRLPCQLIEYKKGLAVEDLTNRLDSFACVADVILDTDIPVYPVRKNNKLIFPIGEIATSLCSPELKFALAHGHVKHVLSAATYHQEQLFTDYIKYFYDLKEHYKRGKQPAMTWFVKYFLVSLYGKFGQRRIIMEECEDHTGIGYERLLVYDQLKGVFLHEYKLFNKWIAEVGIEEHTKSFSAIAAHVTSEARLVLWRIIEDIGVDHVLYCDTDSIKIRKCDFKNISWPVNDYKLGALKLEKEDKRLELWGAKSYITESKRVIKGVPVTAKMIDKFHYEYYTWYKQMTHMNLKESKRFITRKTLKAVIPSYDKGTITPNGKILPFRLSLADQLFSPLLEQFSYVA